VCILRIKKGKNGQKTAKSAWGTGVERGERWAASVFCQDRRDTKNGKLQRVWVEIVIFSVQGNKFGFIT